MTLNLSAVNDPQALIALRPLSGPFTVVDRQSPLRDSVEATVKAGFGAHFGACVEGFMPSLATYREDGAQAIVGYRSAGTERLYLENYLDRPIEAVISGITQSRVRRDEIVEVGQLVVEDRRIVSPLFRALVPHLLENGFSWVCFTGTHKIRRLLSKTGFNGMTVAAAREEAVRGSGDAWGSYYSNDPRVTIGRLADPQGRWCSRVSAAILPATFGE